VANQRTLAKRQKTPPVVFVKTPDSPAFEQFLAAIQAELPTALTMLLINTVSRRCLAYRSHAPVAYLEQLVEQVAAVVDYKQKTVSQFTSQGQGLEEILVTTSSQYHFFYLFSRRQQAVFLSLPTQGTNPAVVREVIRECALAIT
jgi:hypothetical protein